MEAYVWFLAAGLIASFGNCKPLNDSSGEISATRRKRDTERCGQDYTSDHGTITLRTDDINGTEFYSINEDCHWNIHAAIGHQIILRSLTFGVELSDDCAWDYVELEEGGASPRLSRYCGWKPLKYISGSNDLTIIFHSDESYEDTGFTVLFETIDEASIDDTHCNSQIRGGVAGSLSNTGTACLFSIQAPDGQVVELQLSTLSFGSYSCVEESMTIYNGLSTHGNVLDTICSHSSPGQVIRAASVFIDYRNLVNEESLRFELDYRFVEDTFTSAPIPSTTPSPVGGHNDCSGFYKDVDDYVYNSPQYVNNKHCVVVVRNTLLARHVVQVTFTKFELEQSDDCMFDSLKVLSGERHDSNALGGSYCGTSLRGRTIFTNGNSLRLEFNTDESFALFGFQARISFVPTYVCDCEDKNKVCVKKGYEKLCIRGKSCDIGCQNGGTCIESRGATECICPVGFSGKDCSDGEGGHTRLRFKMAPTDKKLKRDDSHIEQCSVQAGASVVTYAWTLNNVLISPYNKKTGFGVHPGGILQIRAFSDQLEGRYACFATTEFGTAEHTFELTLVEKCSLVIFPGPQDERLSVGEDVLFSCHVPLAESVYWKKDGKAIDFERSPRHLKMNNNYLHIKQLELSDQGTYRCEAQDLAGCFSHREAALKVIDVKPLNAYCGISIFDENERSESLISKGSDALPGDNPWHVILWSSAPKKERGFCGGTLISQNWVLTAAHCIRDFKVKIGDWTADNVRLYFGTTHCTGTNGTRRSPKRYIIHPNFERDAVELDSDIALIELDQPIEYTQYIRPICLQTDLFNRIKFFEESGQVFNPSGKVVGCGITHRVGTKPSQLKEVRLPYVDRDECEEALPFGNTHQFSRTMICAGGPVRNTGDTCKGDSGGGLMMATNRQWIQTGIVSWGIGCDKDKRYGYYTNVGIFFAWIKAETKFDEEEVHNFLEDVM